MSTSSKKNRVALVTGGAGDLGFAAAQKLAGMGMAVVLLDLVDEERLRERLEGLRKMGVEAAYLKTDVTNRAAVDGALEKIWSQFGGLDVCLCNAGIVVDLPLLDFTVEQWQRHLDVNLTGYFHVCQAVARRWIAEKRAGKFIFTGSWVQDVPYKLIAPYCVSKAGVWMLARCAALEWAPHGITVNVVAPGIVNAGLTAQEIREHPEMEAEFMRAIPLGKMQTAADVADIVGFLASDAASYMTGATIMADGGCCVSVAASN